MRDDEQHWFNQVSEQLLYVPVARAIPSDSWNASSRRIPWHASRSTRGVHQSPSKIHFGGSVTASMHSDRKAAGHLSMASGARSLVMDFRLAPEHPYPAQLDDAETAYRWLLSQGHEPRNIGSTGHSIGGTLAVRLPLRLLTKGEAAPGAIVSVSPWTDLTLQNASVDENEDNDKMLSRNSLELFRAAWLQEPEWTSPPSRSAS